MLHQGTTPKPPEASENQHLAILEDPGGIELVAGQQEHPERIFQVSGEVSRGSVCGKLELALPMVLAGAVECFTCMSSKSKTKMTFIRCFKECSGM